jgi:hypothetical protein
MLKTMLSSVWGCGLDSSASRQRPVAGSGDHINEPAGWIKGGDFLNQLSYCQILSDRLGWACSCDNCPHAKCNKRTRMNTESWWGRNWVTHFARKTHTHTHTHKGRNLIRVAAAAAQISHWLGCSLNQT